MKRIFLISSVLFSSLVFSQIKTNLDVSQNSASGYTPFLDASSSPTWNGTDNVGKGLVFPRTDLTKVMELKVPSRSSSISAPTRYDGMIVYNTGDGTPGIGATQTPKVTEGFYYYNNKSTTFNGGYWVRIGDGSANKALTEYVHGTPVDTGVTIATKKVYSVSGAFTFAGGITHDLDMPTGFDKMIQIKIYRLDGTNANEKNLVGTTLYSYEVVGGKIRVNFGQGGIISTSYPQGNYEYILEYTKS